MIATGELIGGAVATVSIHRSTLHFVRAVQAITSPIAFAEFADAVVVSALELVGITVTEVWNRRNT